MKHIAHKPLVLPASELELIVRLQDWLGERRVVSFLARLARVQRVEDGVYSVRSASTRYKSYRVDLNRRVCPCESFFYRRRCMHYKLAAVKHLLEA
jgi:hypothetical protein